MLEQKVRILSEGLARGMGRRNFLKQAGTTIFGGMAALAAGQALSGTASASRQPLPRQPMTPQCAPPGPYCNLNGVNEPNACHGGNCFQHLYQGQVIQCRVYYIYQAGCWTTPVSGGYWTCCDCECPYGQGQRTTCGCAQFSATPAPRPDRPSGSADA